MAEDNLVMMLFRKDIGLSFGVGWRAMKSDANTSNQPTKQIKSVPRLRNPNAIHSKLIDELERIRNVRKALGSRAAGLLCVTNGSAIEKIQAVCCSTCGAKPRQKCELHSGQPRTEPHQDRRIAAEDLLSSLAVGLRTVAHPDIPWLWCN
jgi:hypothetical protein